MENYNNVANEVVLFFSGFFGTPALLIGLFALLSSIIQRKKFSEIVISTFKTIIGFLIISGGAGIISGSITKFGRAFELLFNRTGFVPNNDVMPGIFMEIEQLKWVASAGSLILIFGMILNLFIAKISRLKYIYLTGHSAWYFSTMIASIFAVAGAGKEETWLVVIIGALLVSVWMVISPALLNKHMNNITKGNSIALAHTGSLSYLVAGDIGNVINKIKKGNVKSTEDIKVPKGLSFLRNTNVSIALTMLILFMLVFFTAWGVRGKDAMVASEIIKDSDSVVVQGILQAFTFAAGVEVLLIGVRMFIAEIVPAFKGISDKWIRGAKPGIDCPVVFTFAPNAVILGFLSSVLGGFVLFGINIGVSAAIGSSTNALAWSAIIIPSIVPHFFTGAASGVFGNSKGGIWGCIIGGFVNGMLIQLVPWIFVGLNMMPIEIVNKNIVWGDVDFIVGIIPWIFLKFLGGKWVLLGFSIVVWVSIPLIGWLIHKSKFKNNAEYREKFEATKIETKNFKDNLKQLKVEYHEQLDENKKINLSKEESKTAKHSIKQNYLTEIKKAEKEYNKNVKNINTVVAKDHKEVKTVEKVQKGS